MEEDEEVEERSAKSMDSLRQEVSEEVTKDEITPNFLSTTHTYMIPVNQKRPNHNQHNLSGLSTDCHQVEKIACIETYKVFNPNLDFIKEKEVEVVVDRCRLIKTHIQQKKILKRNISQLRTFLRHGNLKLAKILGPSFMILKNNIL